MESEAFCGCFSISSPSWCMGCVFASNAEIGKIQLQKLCSHHFLRVKGLNMKLTPQVLLEIGTNRKKWPMNPSQNILVNYRKLETSPAASVQNCSTFGLSASQCVTKLQRQCGPGPTDKHSGIFNGMLCFPWALFLTFRWPCTSIEGK